MKRLDWQTRLSDLLRARARMPFAWGSNDCCLFAADAVLAMTGTDPAAALRGYDSPRGALCLINAGGGLHAITTAALGDPVSPRLATVGDVVLLQIGRREALGICNGVNVLGPGPDGMAALGMTTALAAWKI